MVSKVKTFFVALLWAVSLVVLVPTLVVLCLTLPVYLLGQVAPQLVQVWVVLPGDGKGRLARVWAP